MANMSKRLNKSSVRSVEEVVTKCIPAWLRYPRCLRMVFGSLYRFGSLDECISTLSRENEHFKADWDKYVTPKQSKELEKFANLWYIGGKLPSKGGIELSFTAINQQLFYETTMRGNTSLYGSPVSSASDVKLAVEGGFSNHVEMERVRNNSARKAMIDRDTKKIVAMKDYEETEGSGDVFASVAVEYATSDEEIQVDVED